MKYAQKAAEDLKGFMKRFQPLMDVAKVLEEVGSLDNAVEEVKKAKLDADSIYSEAVSKKEIAMMALEDVQSKIAMARNHADEIISKAQVKAQVVLSDANAAAKGIEKVAFEKLQKVEALKNGFAGESYAIQKEIEEKKLELSDLMNKISDVKAKLANFLK